MEIYGKNKMIDIIKQLNFCKELFKKADTNIRAREEIVNHNRNIESMYPDDHQKWWRECKDFGKAGRKAYIVRQIQVLQDELQILKQSIREERE